jgi:hypothetical protein
MYSLTWPCNLLTGNHIWIYSSNNSKDSAPDDLLCQCGRVRLGDARNFERIMAILYPPISQIYSVQVSD